MILDIFLTLFLVFLNGFFVAAEFAIVKVRTSQLEIRIKDGSKMAALAKSVAYNLDAYLSATQLGITLASLGLGWIGESVVSEIIKNVMLFIGIQLTPEVIHQIALPTAFVTITILHIVFGELAPKSIAIQRPEAVSLGVSLPLRAFFIVFKPFIWLLNSFANLIIKIFGFEPQTGEDEAHSSEELRYLLEESSKSGVEGVADSKLIENVFDFPDTPVKQVMIPRNKIFAVEVDSQKEEIFDKIIDEGYSRLPVYKETLDNIIGVIYAKDLISMIRHSNLIIVQDLLRPAYFVYEYDKIETVLRQMQRQKIHLGIVLDEFGGVAGIVALEDIIEEIVGEIQDEYDEEEPIVVRLADSEFKVQASSPIDDVNDYLPAPLPEKEDYETVGGLIISEVGRIPKPNELIDLNDYLCKILRSSKRSVETVKLTLKEETD